MSASQHLQQYRRANVASADPVEILMLLLDEAVRSAESAGLEQDLAGAGTPSPPPTALSIPIS